MKISFTPAAEMTVEHLPPPDKRKIDRKLARLRATTVDSILRDVHKLSGDDVWVLRATPDLRVLFRRRGNTITIVDVVRQSRLKTLFLSHAGAPDTKE